MYVEVKDRDVWYLIEPESGKRLTRQDVPQGVDYDFQNRVNFDHRNYTSDFCGILGCTWECWDAKGPLIAQRRELPSDHSEVLVSIQEMFHEGPPNGWMTVAECFALDWERIREVRRMVTAEQAKHFTSPPSPFPKDAMTTVGKDGSKSTSYGANYVKDGVEVAWTERYHETFDDFLKQIEKLRRWGTDENLRLVYWFSN